MTEAAARRDHQPQSADPQKHAKDSRPIHGDSNTLCQTPRNAASSHNCRYPARRRHLLSNAFNLLAIIDHLGFKVYGGEYRRSRSVDSVGHVVYLVAMSDNDDSRRQRLILSAVNPIDGKACEIQISFDRMQAVARRSLGHAKECGYIVPLILQKPSAVFEGFLSDDDEDPRGAAWRCYCGIPNHSYRADGTSAPPWPNQVYLVFVNDEGVAYNRRWEHADSDDRKLPQSYATRFKQRLL